MDYQPLDLSISQNSRYDSGKDGQLRKEDDMEDDEDMSSCDHFSSSVLVKRKKHISSSSDETTSDRIQDKSRDATVASSRDSTEPQAPDESAISPSLHPFMPFPFPNTMPGYPIFNPQNMLYLLTAFGAANGPKLTSPPTPHQMPLSLDSTTPAIPRITSDMSKLTKRSDNNSWKASLPRSSNTGPAPWIDKSLITPNISNQYAACADIFNGSSAADFNLFVKKYANAADCGFEICKNHNYREHFHCNSNSCFPKVFAKKEELIRHHKWHKKRDESLRNGFLRFSSVDDCSEKFPRCDYCRKQTHYHCLKPGCRKTYISTSDVSMHASCHRKDAAIIQQGFQRFRGTEDCQKPSCSFKALKTTHFHCNRKDCNYTFKNKADMEKHKTFHKKDEQLNQDGFKKFMKHESCTFESCRLSNNANHTHCIRVGCTYVPQSVGQHNPHKKRHERKEQDLAYRKNTLVREMVDQLKKMTSDCHHVGENDFPFCNISGLSPEARKIAGYIENLQSADMLNVKLEEIIGPISELIHMDTFKRFNSEAKCFQSECPSRYEEHYHCNKCEHFIPKDNLHNHAKEHLIEEEATKLILEPAEEGTTCREDCALYQKDKHFHCRMYGCNFVIKMTDAIFKRLDHYKLHEDQIISMAAAEPNPSVEAPLSVLNPSVELSPGLPQPVTPPYLSGSTLSSIDRIDGLSMLKRKRGRPPKSKPDTQRPSPVALLDQASSSPDPIHCRLNMSNMLPFGPHS
ncbi:uncharacterized protein LOC141849429 [Brevipalpus obovatus]|uniref:uncharacterized protein LOC141849429 n=1 Tax=Brevipalpus obovatus TaxID=246614 RepID=UPI003D9EFF4F